MSATSAGGAAHEEALRLCAQDAGVEPAALRVLRKDEHYKSRQLYVSAGGPDPTHVIKLNDLAWRPEREHEGYAFLQRAVAEMPTGTPAIGAIRPVGYGVEPAFLVTAFQAGAGLRPGFDAGTGWRASAGERRAAVDRARWIAVWSARTRRFEPQPGGGPDPASLLEDFRRHLDAIRRYLGEAAGAAAARAIPTAERLAAAFSDEERERLGWRFATHGDLAPQNFLVGPDDRLYALDLENFAFMPLHRDLSMFRARLETYALRGPLPRRRAAEVWRAFLDETLAQTPGQTDRWLLMAYLERLLSHLAWLHDPEYLAKQAPGASVANRLRRRFWLRSRLRWLRSLPEDPGAAVRRFSHVL